MSPAPDSAPMEMRMKLIKFEYLEYPNTEKSWHLEESEFQEINLIVGKNSTGKSRLLAVISSLSNLITGRNKPFDSGIFTAEIEIQNKIFNYHINCNGGKVISEKLEVNSEVKFNRDESGEGSIYFEELGQFINFKMPEDATITSTKRDEIQHPYINSLAEWANSVLLLKFGSEFGHRHLINFSDIDQALKAPTPYQGTESENILPCYVAGWNKFGEQFDKLIIEDMKSMGYDLSDVGAGDIRTIMPFPIEALSLYVTEKNLGFRIPQTQLSQGMYRALALAVHINLCALEKSKGVILIDDIGEGLDFERATSIIDLVSKKSENYGIQVFMTSNDRFVMNKVPLRHWIILKRECREVKVYNQKNSKEAFDEFKFMGLNNFDFFSSSFFLGQE